MDRDSGKDTVAHNAFRRRSHSQSQCQWAYIAGYLDGDGSVEIRVGVFTIRFALTWADTYLAQLERVRAFLAHEGIIASRIRAGKSTLGREVWHLSVWQPRSVLQACLEMVDFLGKKRTEVQAVIDYMQDVKNGNEVIRVFNEDKRKGSWSGKLRKEVVPWKMKEGFVLAKRACGWRE